MFCMALEPQRTISLTPLDCQVVNNSMWAYLLFSYRYIDPSFFLSIFFFWICIAVTYQMHPCGFYVCLCRTLPMLSWMTWERTGVTLWSCRQFHTGVRSPSRAPRPFFSLLQAKDNLVQNDLIALHLYLIHNSTHLGVVKYSENSCKCFEFVTLYLSSTFDVFSFGTHSQHGLYK